MRRYAAILIVFALAASACSGDGVGATTTSPVTATPATTTTAAPAPTTTTTTTLPAPTTTAAPAPTTTAAPPPALALGEYLAALFEIGGEFVVAQAAATAASTGDPSGLSTVVTDHLRSLRALRPPAEAEQLQADQEGVAEALAAALQRFARALATGGSAVVQALDEYFAELSDIGERATAADAELREMAATILETAGGSLSSYLASVARISPDTKDLMNEFFEVLQGVTTDPEGALARLAGLADDLEAEHDRWAGIEPPAEAEAIHQRQLQGLANAAAVFRTLGDALDTGGPGPQLVAEVQRVGAASTRTNADWGFLFADALRGEVRPLSGTHVSVVGGGSNAQAVASIRSALELVESESGIRVFYTGVESFPTRLDTMLANGAPPDVGIFLDPRKAIALSGSEIIALPDVVAAAVEEAWPPGWLDIMAKGEARYGVPTSGAMKSLVWYRPQAFAASGYEVPSTWAELQALTDRMIADGNVPWCVGIESGTATGWPFTDWVEDVVLRSEPVGVYDDWIDHTIPFDDPRIAAAWTGVLDLWSEEGSTDPPTGALIANSPWDASSRLLDDSCLMFRQASFVMNTVPEGTRFGPTGLDAFYLPGATPDDRPALVTGSFAAAFRDAPEVWTVMLYLSSAPFAEERQRALAGLEGRPTGFLSANLEQDLAIYSDIERSIVEMMQRSTVTRFDASDLMPDPAGHAFWAQGTRAVTGTASPEEALGAVEEAWLAYEAAYFDVAASLSACIDGDEVACDLLFLLAPQGSRAASVGFDCGGRRVDPGTACSGYDGTSAGAPGDDPLLDALLGFCVAGNTEACDRLYLLTPEGSGYRDAAGYSPST